MPADVMAPYFAKSPWINNHMPSKLWDEIIHQFPNINGSTVEVGIKVKPYQ